MLLRTPSRRPESVQFHDSTVAAPGGPTSPSETPDDAPGRRTTRQSPANKHIRILGIRGIPAAHGGFETFAEHLALFLRPRGWTVTVYCQQDGDGEITEDYWRDIHRVHIPVSQPGALGTIFFDWKATLHAARTKDLCLTLGYNTAVFCALLRMKGAPNLINMDGIEWKRGKWGSAARTWFWMNDWLGCWLGNHLIADHPQIQEHLETRVNGRKITMIPYGSDRVDDAPVEPLARLGLERGRYYTLIARPEPENSVLETVQGFSRRRRGMTLAVLGQYDPANPYHRAVMAAASDEVRFLGAIYDKEVLASLRFHCRAYVHGHTVGGTNPSLVEALGAGNAVIANDNRFNRWVAGEGAVYFGNADECARCFDDLGARDQLVASLSAGARKRHADAFEWNAVLTQYENLLEEHLAA
jgi:glycosyltransferase involved in cell wall biosynthesis